MTISAVPRMRGRWQRLIGSVRLRVSAMAAGLFAATLVVGSVALLDVLEDRLVDDIRRADQGVLQAQAARVRAVGLPGPSVPLTVPWRDGRAISFALPAPTAQPIVATATGRVSGALAGAGQVPPGSFDFVAEADPTAAVVPVDAVPAGPATGEDADPVDVVAFSPTLFGVAGQAGPFLVSSVQVADGLSLSTASSLAVVDHTLDTTRTVLWVLVPVLVLLVAGSSWMLVSRALRPVHLLTAGAATISSTSLHERLPVPPAHDEVAELATTMNSMLERLERATTASRRLVSDASHELRTPITVMRAELEVARGDAGADWSTVSAGVLVEVERLQTLVDDLLLLARLGERAPHSARLSLLDVVRDSTARRRAVAVQLVVDSASPFELDGDGPAIGRAIDHVVANAARHASRRVEVRLVAEGDGVAVQVDDDGPGIAPEDRDRVLERFVRLDEGRSRDAGGSGLGLAVASEVLRAHGGTITIGESPLGGTRVSLAFAPEAAGTERA